LQEDDVEGEVICAMIPVSPADSAPQAQNLLDDWNKYGLHPLLLRALHRQNFTTPTPIQSKALPPALNKRDVVGVAETVSFIVTPLSYSATFSSTR
jgi:superfamily II DNA/RNA helicase